MFDLKVPLRFTVMALVALAVILCSGTGCRRPQKQAGPPEKITLAYVNNFGCVLVHIALKKGFFAEEGLDVAPQSHSFGKQALQAVVEGKADLATVGDTPIMFTVMNGKKIMILATIQTSNRNEAIVTRMDRGMTKPSDLKGKKIGVTLGSTSDFFADVFLQAHGLGRKQVNIIDLKPEEMVDALRGGKVDAAVSWNPVLTQMQKKLGNEGRTFYGQTLYTEFFCLTAMQDFVKKNPEAIRKTLRALIRAEAFLQQHPEDSQKLVTESIKTDQAFLKEIWDNFHFKVTLNQALLMDLEDQSRWAMRSRLTTRRDMPNYLDYIYINGLLAVKPEAVRIIR